MLQPVSFAEIEYDFSQPRHGGHKVEFCEQSFTLISWFEFGQKQKEFDFLTFVLRIRSPEGSE